MSQCDPNNCTHSSHAAEASMPVVEVEAPASPPPQIETAATRRFDAIAAEKAKREAARAEAERLKAEGAVQPPAPPAPRSDYEPSAQVRATQKLLEQIEQRKVLRARLVAEKLRRGVEIEGELRQAMKDRDARLEAVEAKAREQLAAISSAFEDLGQERAGELNVRDHEISKLDRALEQLGKQLHAELAKVTGG